MGELINKGSWFSHIFVLNLFSLIFPRRAFNVMVPLEGRQLSVGRVGSYNAPEPQLEPSMHKPGPHLTSQATATHREVMIAMETDDQLTTDLARTTAAPCAAHLENIPQVTHILVLPATRTTNIHTIIATQHPLTSAAGDVPYSLPPTFSFCDMDHNASKASATVDFPATTLIAEATRILPDGQPQVMASMALPPSVAVSGRALPKRLATGPIVTITSIVVASSRTSDAVTTQTSSSARPGPPIQAIIGGAVGAAVVVLTLALILSCRMIRRRRLRRRADLAMPAPTLVHPFTGGRRERISTSPPPPRKRLPSINISYPPSHQPDSRNNSPSEYLEDFSHTEEFSTDPVLSDRSVQEARNALDHLQALTSQLEGELHRLSALARSGELSDADRARLNEIRHIAGLTMPLGRRPGRMPSTTTTTTFGLPPPSYQEK